MFLPSSLIIPYCMTFSDTYAQEVLQSRRTRSQRAGFWAKIVSILLAVTVIATFRSEPELRQGLTLAASDAVLKLTGRQAALSAAASRKSSGTNGSALQEMMQKQGAMPQPDMGRLDAVKVNRPGLDQGQSHLSKRVSPAVSDVQTRQSRAAQVTETSQMADQLDRLLRDMQPGL